MKKSKATQSHKDLEKIEKESLEQALPKQRKVLSASDKISRKTTNLPSPTHAPMGWKDGAGYDHIFPWVKLPRMHPINNGDTVIFNNSDAPANKLILGDNLEILRTLPSECIDLIYIDPPFFSGRNYNVIWGDTNEVRSFFDIWEGGIDSYLVWLNARLWEMKRVLKKTGSIYVHCDWHASHYIKTEMDKIFGYENFRNEIIWGYTGASNVSKDFPKKHDVILRYSKTKEYIFNKDSIRVPYAPESIKRANRQVIGVNTMKFDKISLNKSGKVPEDYWLDIIRASQYRDQYVGYPTEKPSQLLERIILASSDKDDIVADFFCGGGTTLAVAMKNKRNFIGCDSSRVAISVTLDRLVKVGEDISGVMSNLSKDNKKQLKISGEKVSNIEIDYLGVYPVEKFKNYPQGEFVNFVLSCYGASSNTAEGFISGYRPPAQNEPILVGSSDQNKSIDVQIIKKFFNEIKEKLEPNKLVNAKIIGWRFSRQVMEYIKILEKYIEKNNLPLKMELIPLDSKEFRTKVLQRYPDVNQTDFFLRFSKAPVIGDIKVKKINDLEYEFEAIDAFSTNEGGWLVNCQWDFDYQEGHFCADKNYILSREKVKDKKKGEIFKATLKANHKFEKSGEWPIACKIQDNLAGETILSKKIKT